MFLRNLKNHKDRTLGKQGRSNSHSNSISNNTTHKKTQKHNQSAQELSPRVK